MNYYETGKTDGTSQFEMDKLTETKREGEQLAYTAMVSLTAKFERAPDRISQAHYVGGFVEGYMVAIIRKRQEECQEAEDKYDELELSSHIPRETIQRKQYAINAQIVLLQTIIDEIEAEADKVTK